MCACCQCSTFACLAHMHDHLATKEHLFGKVIYLVKLTIIIFVKSDLINISHLQQFLLKQVLFIAINAVILYTTVRWKMLDEMPKIVPADR